MKIALFYGHYSSNIGDVAINAGVAGFLRRVFGRDFQLTVFFLDGSGDALAGKESFATIAGCEFSSVYTSGHLALRYLQAPDRFLAEIGVADYDLVLVNGGEHFFSYQDNSNWHNLFWRALPLVSARALGIRGLFLPSSFGPFDDQDAAAYMGPLLGSDSLFACRDQASSAYLQESGFAESVPALLDMAFFAEATHHHDADTGAVKHVGIAVRPDGHGLRVGAQASQQQAARFEETGFQESLSFVTTCQVIDGMLADQQVSVSVFVQTNADRGLGEALVAHFKDRNDDAERVSLVFPESIDDYIAKLAACDVIYTSRFHAVILSIVAGTPAFAVYFNEHGHKMPGLFDSLGYSQLCLLLETPFSEQQLGHVCDSLRALPGRFPAMLEQVDALREQTGAAFLSACEGAKASADPVVPPAEVWEPIVRVSELRAFQTRLQAEKHRQREIIEARDAAYARLKERERSLVNDKKALAFQIKELQSRGVRYWLKALLLSFRKK